MNPSDKNALDSINNNDKVADYVGKELANLLCLIPDPEHPDRWMTGFGTKTNIGLARTLLYQMAELAKNS